MKTTVKVSISAGTTASGTTASGTTAAHFKLQCSSCDGHVKSVRREFSNQAWAALVAWQEIGAGAVDEAICNDCYFNFRDVLIDRADEMRLIATNTASATVSHATAMAARA